MKKSEEKIEVFSLSKKAYHSLDNFIMSTNNVVLALAVATVSGLTICGTFIADVIKSPVVLIHNKAVENKKNSSEKQSLKNIDFEK